MIKICNILSYLEENQKPFLAQWSVDMYRKRIIFFFFNYLSGHMYFSTLVRSQLTRTYNLKYPKTGLFLSLLSVIFGILTPKNLPIQNFKMKGWLEQQLLQKT